MRNVLRQIVSFFIVFMVMQPLFANPPGLKDKIPQGLEGKNVKGWEQGEKKGWHKTHKKHVKKIKIEKNN